MKYMAVILLTLSIMTNGSSQASSLDGAYEMRVYYAAPGKLNALIKRFQDHTTALFEKHGMINVGYWLPVNNTENKLIYILKYPTFEAKVETWKNFMADPEWIDVKAKSEATGKLVDKVESTMMASAPFSPYVGETEKNRGVFELRVYDPEVGKLDDLLARFQDHTVALFEKHGMENIAYWVANDKDGHPEKLVYIISHESIDAGKASFDGFRKDEDWIKAKTESEANGRLTTNVSSTYMTALPFSKIK